MTGEAKRKVMAAIRLAEDVGAQEIVDELQELLDMDVRRECKKSMAANGMTMYCTEGCCPDYTECRKAEARVALDVAALSEAKKPNKKAGSTAATGSVAPGFNRGERRLRDSTPSLRRERRIKKNSMQNATRIKGDEMKKRGSKRGREHTRAAKRKDHTRGITFMSMGLPAHIVKSINRESRSVGLDIQRRKAS